MPYANSLVTRFDKSQTFTSASAWQTYDAGVSGNEGAVYNGRYLYLVPLTGPTSGMLSSIVTQFDTSGSFTAPVNWTSFDTAQLPGQPTGFVGGVFDGHHVYLVPFSAGTTETYLTRFVTKTLSPPFLDAGAWQTFQVSTFNGGAIGFAGAAFDGRYVYFVPYNYGNESDGLIAQYDTTGDLDAGTAWSFFNIPKELGNADAVGFSGAAFDGTYLYLAPRVGHTVVRYKTTGTGVPSTVHGGSFL